MPKFVRSLSEFYIISKQKKYPGSHFFSNFGQKLITSPNKLEPNQEDLASRQNNLRRSLPRGKLD